MTQSFFYRQAHVCTNCYEGESASVADEHQQVNLLYSIGSEQSFHNWDISENKRIRVISKYLSSNLCIASLGEKLAPQICLSGLSTTYYFSRVL